MSNTRTVRIRTSLRRALTAVLLASLTSCGAGDGFAGGILVQPDGTEHPYSTAQWQDQWLLINYWAEWCAPCRHEIPELNAVNARDDVQVLGVNFDGILGDKLVRAAAQLQIAFPTSLSDPGATLGAARPTVLPVTLVVGPDGTLRQTLAGPQDQRSLLLAMGLAANATGDSAAPRTAR